jgi:hypothetical protein
VGRLTGEEDRVLEAANAALKAFRRIKPFWPSSDGRNEDLNLSRARLRSV